MITCLQISQNRTQKSKADLLTQFISKQTFFKFLFFYIIQALSIRPIFSQYWGKTSQLSEQLRRDRLKAQGFLKRNGFLFLLIIM